MVGRALCVLVTGWTGVAAANEVDDAISRALVVPAKIYEEKEAKHRQCLVEHAKEERLAAASHAVVMERKLVDETRDKIALMQAQRSRGEKVDPVIEANAARWLPQYEERLQRDWDGYKNVGGPAESIGKVVEIPGPCGPPPRRPTY